MNIYYDEINRRADPATWKRKLDSGEATFEDWKHHWLDIAEKWHYECSSSGFPHTAKHILEIIRANR